MVGDVRRTIDLREPGIVKGITLTEELEKRVETRVFVSFGFSASNASGGWIPLHHRSQSEIQPEMQSPR